MDHLLRHCRAYDELRAQLSQKVKRDMTDLKKLLGNDNNMSYVTTFVKKMKQITWMLKQEKVLPGMQNDILNRYTTRERHGSRETQRRQNTQSDGVRAASGGTHRAEGERVSYARGDIRNWLIVGNRGDRSTSQRERVRPTGERVGRAMKGGATALVRSKDKAGRGEAR